MPRQGRLLYWHRGNGVKGVALLAVGQILRGEEVEAPIPA